MYIVAFAIFFCSLRIVSLIIHFATYIRYLQISLFIRTFYLFVSSLLTCAHQFISLSVYFYSQNIILFPYTLAPDIFVQVAIFVINFLFYSGHIAILSQIINYLCFSLSLSYRDYYFIYILLFYRYYYTVHDIFIFIFSSVYILHCFILLHFFLSTCLLYKTILLF